MLPITGTHSTARRVIAATGLVGLGLTLPCITATTASAAPVSVWDKVASCESTNDWSIDTGNGFYGGLQFTSSTWAAYGGHQYASQANQATKDQQISVAEKVLADQGPGAWPVCSIQAGLTRGGAAPVVDTSAGSSSQSTATTHSATRGTQSQDAAPAAAAPAPAATPAPATTATSYTVVAGDWLSTIAQNQNVQGGWQKLYELNKSVLTEGPDTIYPGEQLSLGSVAAAPATTTASDTAAAPAAAPSVKLTSAKSSAKAATSAKQAVSGSMGAAISFAESKLGQAYVYGGTSNGGWDCSGLTQAALAQAGISVPRVAADQAASSTHVSLDNLQPGDLLFWSNNGADSGVYHVAIYTGNGQYVEAANPRAGVKSDTISNWAPDFAGRV